MPEPLFIDNSTLKAVARCSTEAMLRYAYGFTDAEERAALRAGTAFHKLAETHFRGGTRDAALAAFDESYREFSDAHVSPVDRLAHSNLTRIVGRWLDAHSLPSLPFVVPPDLVEIGFSFPLTDDGSIVFCGRLDGAALYQQSLYVLELKSTGRINADWLDGFSLDSQNTGYIWALQQHTGKPVAGTFLCAVQFDKLPGGVTPGGKDPRKCPEHKVSHAECGDLHATHKMVMLTRTPEAIEEWRKTTLSLARKYADMLARWPTLESLHKLRTQGRHSGACRFCGFKQFCKLDRRMSYIADGNLIHEPWSPYDRATAESLPTAHTP